MLQSPLTGWYYIFTRELHNVLVLFFSTSLQAKSCDERDGGRDSKRVPSDRRLTLEAEQSVIRHNTTHHLQPETPVAAACQSLWAAKGHLEELHALGISDPSSASTSFESNTDNSVTENKARDDSADKKRLQYRSSKQFRRRISVISNDEPPLTYQNSHESDISHELQKIFDRGNSHSSDSRKSSQSTLYDKSSSKDARNTMLDGQPRRTSYNIRDFNRDRRRRSCDFFYGRHTGSSSHLDFPQSNSHSVVCGTLSRRLPRELPMLPIFEQNRDIIGGDSCAINERHLRHDENSSYEQSKNRKKRKRRPGSHIQHATIAYDADFWPRNRPRDPWESRSLLLRRKFLSTAAVSSLDSTNSTESSAPDAMFVSSVDSGGSDLGYVDEHSDSLFREWSRVDPAYEERDVSIQRYPRRQLIRGVSEDQSPLRGDRQRTYTRQYSANPRTSNVMVPLIRYPDEANCNR
ncbi:unnamed protein product [Angiostrongylus costaricensis]|uniref:PEHE domain-containing protein n=1 Tax=Angiostrongylus costaricensis TaxID=334426 RepID=A0A158PL53_ANGCS|nr:unnamed protein product [Angiostrongylus costaricensis]